MWSEDTWDAEDDLRQGDLLQSFCLPKWKLPLVTTVTTGRGAGPDDFALAKLGKPKYLLVVSQCCTIQNNKVVAVAPIVSTNPLDDSTEPIYRNNNLPVGDEDLAYVYTHHVIDSYRGEHPKPLEGRRLNAANFLEIQTISGDTSELKVRRVARMNVVARRDLRRNLAAFWSRTEAEDHKELLELGESLD